MTGATETTAPRARRPAVVCDQCRTRKLKCDRKFPCSRCLKAVDHRICSYTKAPGPKAQTVNCAEIPVSLQSLDPRTAASEPTVVNFDTTPVQERNIESQYPQRRYTEDQNKAHDIFPSWCYHGQGSWQSLLRHMNGFYDYVHEAIISVPATLKNHNQIVTRIAGAYIQNEPQPETAELTDLCSLIPDHDISVALIQQYEQFWENKFRIIHMPTFWREYHKLQLDHSKAALEYPAKLLLVLLLGLQLHQSGNSDLVPGIETLPGDSGLLWLNAVEYWLFKHCQRNKPNLDLLQIHCLLTLPNRPHTTHTWHSYGTTGYLVKLATMMGLHRDPANMPHLSFAEIEMRRRLWATVLEIEISHSLDRGLMPMFTLDMFDTQPPSNLNDEDLEGENPTAMHNGPSDCWFQITLLQSLPLRLKVCQALSSPRATLTYQDAFSLDAELNDALLYLQSTSGNMISMLPEAVRGQWSARITILDLHIRRCLLAIHQAVIVNSTYQPRIYYFRVACLDSASAFLSAQTTLLPGELASSLLLSSELHAFILVCYLLTQDGWPALSSTPGTLSNMCISWIQTALEESRDACAKNVFACKRGLKEYTIKCFLLAYSVSRCSSVSIRDFTKAAAEKYGDICSTLYRALMPSDLEGSASLGSHMLFESPFGLAADLMDNPSPMPTTRDEDSWTTPDIIRLGGYMHITNMEDNDFFLGVLNQLE